MAKSFTVATCVIVPMLAAGAAQRAAGGAEMPRRFGLPGTQGTLP